MKVLLIFFIVLLQYRDSNCAALTPLQSLTQHVTNFANFVVTSIYDAGLQLSNMVMEKFKHSPEPRLQKPVHIVTPDVIVELIKAAETKHEKEIEEYVKLKADASYHLRTDQLATLHGKKVQIHGARTKDGYLLTLHRILASRPGVNRSVLLHHGLMGSSADWVLLGANKSLPYLLSDAGYDVWLTNARGNNYTQHVNLSSSSSAFWNFTWQEMGMYDLPAVIDYIRLVRNSSDQIDFVGYSTGATALLVLLSTKPVYNDYLRIGVLLAPLAFMSNVKGPLKVLSTISMNPTLKIRSVLGLTKFLPSRVIPNMLIKRYCLKSKIFCSNPLFFMSGGLKKTTTKNQYLVEKLLYNVPSDTSTHTIFHYGQLVNSGKFHAYNNVKEEFPLKKVTLPLAVFSSSADWLATVPDVVKLFVNIVNPINHTIFKKDEFTHTEFMWGANAKELVFSKVMEILEKNPNNVTKLNEV